MGFRHALGASIMIHGAVLGFHYQAVMTADLAVAKGSAASSYEVAARQFQVTVAPLHESVEFQDRAHDLRALQEGEHESVQDKEPVHDQEASQAAVAGVLARQAEYFARNRGPVYPRVAVFREYEGEVLLHIAINLHGTVESVSLVRSSGYDILDKAAVQAAGAWHFSLPETHGLSQVAIEQRIIFELR